MLFESVLFGDLLSVMSHRKHTVVSTESEWVGKCVYVYLPKYQRINMSSQMHDMDICSMGHFFRDYTVTRHKKSQLMFNFR